MRQIVLVLALIAVTVAPAIGKPSHPTQWTFYSVTDFNGVATKITGINNRRKIVGFVQGRSTAGFTQAITATGPPYSRFDVIGYPGASQSEANALDNTFDQAGSYHGLGAVTALGYLRQHGRYTSLQYPVYGINHILCPNGGEHCHGDKNHTQGDLLAVGPNGDVGYELDTVTGAVATLAMPGNSHTTPVGINGRGDVVGDYGLGAGIWLLRYKTGQYQTFVYPGAKQTFASGLNWQKQIVGSFVDTQGVVHGFILSYPWESAPQQIDVPGARTTVVMSINDHVDLAGWYVDTTGVTRGFVAVPQK